MNQISTSIPLKEVPQGRLGIWLLIAGELVIFGGLIAAYLLYRFRYPEWADQASNTSTLLGGINTFVLLTSSYFVVMAHAVSVKKQYDKIVLWMGLAIGCGLIFLVVKTIEYSTEMSQGYTMTSPLLVEQGDDIGSLFWSFYYFMTGLHAVHVLVGMIAMFVVMMSASKGKNVHRVELVGMYWHMIDIIWIFLFPLLYIAK